MPVYQGLKVRITTSFDKENYNGRQKENKYSYFRFEGKNREGGILSTEVGQVHFGICYLVRLLGGDVFVRETEKMTGEWMSLAEAEKKIPDMESWSAIAVSALSVRK